MKKINNSLATTYYSDKEQNYVTIYRTSDYETLAVVSHEYLTINLTAELSSENQTYLIWKYETYDMNYMNYKELVRYGLRNMSELK